MQLAQHVGLAAVVGGCSDRGQHGGQVIGGHARQADLCKIGRREGGAAVGGHRLNGVGDAGQGVDFGHAVHLGGLQATDDVVEQAQVFGIGGGSTDGGTDGGVVGGGRVGCGGGVRGGVSGCSGGVVGFAQNGVVGVDDGLHFGRGVRAVFVVGVAQGGIGPLLAVDGVVDRIQIGGAYTGHTRGHVVAL